jgi:NADPH-dependent glutamate synthase beta subunit-like oxidoreductase
MLKKSSTEKPDGVAIIGSNVAAIQTALTLAQMGVKVKIISDATSLGWDNIVGNASDSYSATGRLIWSLLLQVVNHPLITLYTNAKVESIEGEKGNFKTKVIQRPRYINEDLCSNCGRCEIDCSAKITSLLKGQKTTHSAIHTPILDSKSIPSTYVIDKNGVSPCQVSCPLNINVQGFVSLIANDKTDKALALINEAAPLAGILGRVCGHSCENECNRAHIDSPLSIRALHRFAADNASTGISYSQKLPVGSHEDRIAIIGSGPAGLTAAWELARQGYSPTIFESHSVIGGMLATGIPRFRLPKEIREREINAIIDMGVNIRTGITVGRDVSFFYLKERGFRTFFISIGAQKNNWLNIPGENLEGVVDCLSLLLTLNLGVDTLAGYNIVVVGGGNAAIDSARIAPRFGATKSTIIYRRTRAEMPAAPEEVDEALHEGVCIEYNVMPVEILGNNGKVTGIRCQRTEVNKKSDISSRSEPQPIPGSDFIIDADHVVMAIGQSPDASQLNLDGLRINKRNGVIQVDPLTLESSIPGVFAGGDCVTGPNNVVEAMAAGLRAAESIDRYIQGYDLAEGRSLEPAKIADIDFDTIQATPDKRAAMPVLRIQTRLNSFEETTTGLSTHVGQREAQRCINCALCSHCMECIEVCQLSAVYHDDSIRQLELDSEVVLEFTSDTSNIESAVEGIHTISSGKNNELSDQITKALALGLRTSFEIDKSKTVDKNEQESTDLEVITDAQLMPSKLHTGSKRIGVVLCNCGSSINSTIDFKAISKKLSDISGIIGIQEVAQSCTEDGAKQIASLAAEWQIDRLVLGACRCCNLGQVCFSCTDRRIMCQQYLNQNLLLPDEAGIEFVNIREQCAWVHKDDHKGATHKALQIITAGINRAKMAPLLTIDSKSILPSVLIIGGSSANFTAAKALTARNYQVEVLAENGIEQYHSNFGEEISKQSKQFQNKLTVKPWPNSLKLSGTPGNFEAILEYGSETEHVHAGSILLDIEELSKVPTRLFDVPGSNGLLSRIISMTANSDPFNGIGSNLLRELTVKETGGIFLLRPSDINTSIDDFQRGLAVAARISAYLEQKTISPRLTSVIIDSKLCRDCGNCADICPYIEMRTLDNGLVSAYVNSTLCLGCGACITSCPTGAITQPIQSNKQIASTLRSLLSQGQVLSEV